MTATEFLKSKKLSWLNSYKIEFPDGDTGTVDFTSLLNEYHAIASGKLDSFWFVDKKFENKIEKDYTGPKLPDIEIKIDE